MFAPLPGAKVAQSAIQSFTWQITDDKQYAIVEFTALNASAFDTILTDSRVLKAFLKGKDKKEDIERELKKLKKDYSGSFQTGARP